MTGTAGDGLFAVGVTGAAGNINTGGRGYLRGHVYTEDGTHVASVTQETLLWDPRRR